MDAQARVKGALLGLAAADALAWPLARLAPAEARERHEARGDGPRVHGAITTWTLNVLDAVLQQRPGESLSDELLLRMEVLCRPFRGAALRGGPQTLAGTLLQVAKGAPDVGSHRAALDGPRADGTATALVFGFAARDDDEDVVRSLVEATTVVHVHPEPVGATALWVGALRAVLQGGSGEELWEPAQSMATLALDELGRLGGAPLAPRAAGEGALALAVATARNGEVDALLPPGIDARDAPARVAAAAVAYLVAGAPDVHAVGAQRLLGGGDVDVVLPLLGAGAGAFHGADGLPLAWLDRLATRELVLARARAIFEGARAPPLVEDEIRISRRWQERAEELAPPPPALRQEAREQLKLL